MTWKSTDETRLDCEAAMGKDLGRVFHALSEEVFFLHLRWSQYCALYATAPDRVELLNQTAPLFFRVVQDTLFQDVVLGLARLVDRESTAGKANLTIRRLPGLLRNPWVRVAACSAVQKVIETARFSIDWRHQFLAHRDLQLSLRMSASALPPADKTAVDAALGSLRRLLNGFQAPFGLGITVYASSPTPGDAEVLLGVLKDAQHYRRERESHWH